MSAFTEKDIRAFAAKATLRIDAAEEAAYAKGLNETYEFLSIIADEYGELEKTPPEDSTPAVQPSAKREGDSLQRKDVLSLAPETDGAFIRVPRVLPSKGEE